MTILRLIGIAIVILSLLVVFIMRETDTTATTEENERRLKTAVEDNVADHAVQVIKPERQDIVNTLNVPATIAPWAQATLYAKVSGYLLSMEADKGDRVKKGQLLAVIDAPEIREQYEQAEAQYAIKQVTARRLTNVWQANADVIAKQDVDLAEAEAKAARHMADSRRTMLNYTRVYAPFPGVITARFADPGALIQSAANSSTQTAPLFTLMDLGKVRVYASVPQEVAAFAKSGTPVVVTLRESPENEIHGTITRTTWSLDPATRTLLIEIDLPNDHQVFQPGMFANAKLILEKRPNALTLPTSALIPGQGTEPPRVLVVENKVVHRVPVKVGLDDGVRLEIVEGLTGSEDVVVVGKAGLSDGTKVKASPYNVPAGSPAKQKY
jgi:RND family efflux transporter MFP subunit